LSKKEEFVVGLDIGTTKICALVAEISKAREINIIGIGTHPSLGLRKGVVVNIESTVASVKKAVEEAELMAGIEIDSVYVGIAGGHIRGFNSHGVVAVKEGEVTNKDIRRAIDAATAVAMPLDREVIHVLPQEFIVDDQDGIRDPLGISGVRLEVKVHIVTGAVASAQNIIKSCNRAGLNVKDIVLQQLASSEAVLTPDEKDLGVALVDVGGGTTDLAIYYQGSIKHTSVIALGGNHVTNDIAVGLRTPTKEAEMIKRKYGCAFASLVKANETVEVTSMGGREPRILSRKVLSEIIQPRVEEIFRLIHQEIKRSGIEDLISSGVVITGGASIMEGIQEVGEQVFELPVRLGTPSGVGGLVDIVSSPLYSTAVGLILYAVKNHNGKGFGSTSSDTRLFNKVLKRMKEWIQEFF